jgi:hypothetical protein
LKAVGKQDEKDTRQESYYESVFPCAGFHKTPAQLYPRRPAASNEIRADVSPPKNIFFFARKFGLSGNYTSGREILVNRAGLYEQKWEVKHDLYEPGNRAAAASV